MPWKEKTPDEVSKELFGVDAATAKARFAKLDEMQELLTKSTEKIDAQNILIQELSTSLKNMPKYEPPPRHETQQQAQPELTEWGVDADKAFNERVAPLSMATLDTRAMLSKRNVMDNMNAQYHDWHLFNDEIEEISKNSPLQSKVLEDFWRNCYFAVKGRHHDDIVRDQNQKSGKFWLEPASSAVMMRDEPEKKDPVELLTAEQKRIAEGLGVPLKTYAENIGKFSVRG